MDNLIDVDEIDLVILNAGQLGEINKTNNIQTYQFNDIFNINVLSNTSSVHIYRSLNTDFESCTICRENFNPNSIVRKINGCGHVFHINCIDTWFESNITCPICRVDLRDTLNATDDEMVDAEEG